jgi:hypothetical protein
MKPRGQGASLTGNSDGMAAPAPAPPTSEAPAEEETPEMRAELVRLKEDVQKNPNDLDARLELAYAYLVRRQMMGVYDQTQYVLERKPGHPRALAYQAVVKLSMNDPSAAEQMLKQALATDPNLLEGWIHLALVYTQTNRFDDATNAMKEAIKRHPEEPKLTDILAEIRARAAEVRMQPAATPQPAGASPSPAAGGSGSGISGIIDVDPSLKGTIPSGTVVFVIARPAGVTAGPPAAVKRMRTGNFPMDFQLTSADSMMGAGQPLPASMRVEVRVDLDGNPMTKDPNDPVAVVDNLQGGATSVKLLLRK